MSKLVASLNNLAALRGSVHSDSECCSFCGRERGEHLFLGPHARICWECTVLALGMFLISFRDGLSFRTNYRQLFKLACSEYMRAEGHEPPMRRGKS